MRIIAYLEGGPFDGHFRHLYYQEAPVDLRVGTIGEDWEVPAEGVEVAVYRLHTLDEVDVRFYHGARYRYQGTRESASSLVDLWVE